MSTSPLTPPRHTPFVGSHDDFWENDVTYYNGDKTTRVVHSQLTLPTIVEDKPHPSLRAMLLANGSNLRDLAHSHLPRAPFTATVTSKKETYTVENKYFYERCSLNGQQYKDTTGKVRQVYQAVTSSEDRSSTNLHMARVLYDPKTGESISYASRPDNDSRALAQATDIFRTEKLGNKKGLLKKKKSGAYTLTYVVNSLTNPVKIQSPFKLDERKSLDEEFQALQDLKGKTVTIDGYQVTLNPIHVHHTLSVFGELANILPDSLNGIESERNINGIGYSELLEYAKTRELKEKDHKKRKLIRDTAFQLQNSQLTVSERLIVVDFLTRLCKLPIVHHCKSMIDRTSVATSVATMNHFILNGDLIRKIPRISDANGKKRFAIHKLLDNTTYKDFFVSFMNINHQIPKDSRLGILSNGKLIGRAALGLNLKSGLLAATGALPFFPDSDKKPTILSRGSNWRATALGTLYFLIVPMIITYYALLIIGSIPLLLTLKKKTGSFQIDFLKIVYTIPFRIKWNKIKNLNFEKTFNLESDNINGDGRHLLCAAKHIRDKDMPDPRLSLIPAHLVC